MSQIDKLLSKFKKVPKSVTYKELEKILIHSGFEKVAAKGSHVKFKHQDFTHDIVIPVHKGECKDFYKKQVYKVISKII
jgi:predicted RNA binding protein YcfA (HicA-like mRNA interferase family)